MITYTAKCDVCGHHEEDTGFLEMSNGNCGQCMDDLCVNCDCVLCNYCQEYIGECCSNSMVLDSGTWYCDGCFEDMKAEEAEDEA